MSNKRNDIPESTMTDEQILGAFNIGDFKPVEGKVITPEAEVVETPKTSGKEVKTRRFSFKIENSLGGEEPRKERFKLSEEDEELKQFLITQNEDFGFDEETGEALTPSKFLARQRPRVHIGTIEEATGLAYGVFNGAGARAITMYNPDHPDAPTSGPNYGKVFYRWGEARVEGLLHAIFDECFIEEETQEE